MKVGDYVKCKNSLVIKTSDYEIIGRIVPGNLYKIDFVDNESDEVWIKVDDFFQSFNVNVSIPNKFSPFNYIDYFYTKQEERKIKLENIKNV